jgi:hypothetical protein
MTDPGDGQTMRASLRRMLPAAEPLPAPDTATSH